MPHPVVHFEIRSKDPDATRGFFGDLFGWEYSDGGLPGYTYVNTGAENAIPGGPALSRVATTRLCSSSASTMSRRR